MSNKNTNQFNKVPFTSQSRGLVEIVKSCQKIPVTVLGSYKVNRPIEVSTLLNTAITCAERITNISPKAPGMTESSREEALAIAWGVVGWLQEFSMSNPIQNCGGTGGGNGAKGSNTFSLCAMKEFGQEPEGGEWSINNTSQ